MTKKEKSLLLNVLCALLPYDVKGKVYAETTNGNYDMNGDMIFFDSPFDVILDSINTSTEEIHVVSIGNEDTVEFIECQQTDAKPYTIEEFKPYLRPMSSMTKEEREHLQTLHDIISDENYGDGFSPAAWEAILDFNNYCREHHLDNGGLITLGLAIEAPEGMY